MLLVLSAGGLQRMAEAHPDLGMVGILREHRRVQSDRLLDTRRCGARMAAFRLRKPGIARIRARAARSTAHERLGPTCSDDAARTHSCVARVRSSGASSRQRASRYLRVRRNGRAAQRPRRACGSPRRRSDAVSDAARSSASARCDAVLAQMRQSGFHQTRIARRIPDVLRVGIDRRRARRRSRSDDRPAHATRRACRVSVARRVARRRPLLRRGRFAPSARPSSIMATGWFGNGFEDLLRLFDGRRRIACEQALRVMLKRDLEEFRAASDVSFMPVYLSLDRVPTPIGDTSLSLMTPGRLCCARPGQTMLAHWERACQRLEPDPSRRLS